MWHSLIGVVFAAFSKPLVVTSVQPLYCIAKEIAADTLTIDSLIPASCSPHCYKPCPNDFLKIKQSKLLLWIGPEYEGWISKIAKDLPLLKTPGLKLYPYRFGQGTVDPHIWLDPENAIVIARDMAEKFSALKPENAALYRERYSVFSKRVRNKAKALKLKLQKYQGVKYGAWHDAYQYFDAYFGTKLNFVYHDCHSIAKAQNILSLHQAIKQSLIQAFFCESQFVCPNLKLPITIGVLDPLADVEYYEKLLENITNVFVKCYEDSFLKCSK